MCVCVCVCVFARGLWKAMIRIVKRRVVGKSIKILSATATCMFEIPFGSLVSISL